MRLRDVIIFFATAVGYFVLGWLGLLMALPPGSVTAIWPASGLAIAVVLLYGARLPSLLGIWCGSFLLNLFVFQVNHFALIPSVFTAAAIAAGSSIQSFLGAKLINFSCIDDSIRFSGIALAISTVASTIGTLSLHFASFMPWSIFGWITWWIGDAIGMIVVTPFLWCLWRHVSRRELGETLIIIVLLVGLGFIVFQNNDAKLLTYLLPVLMIWPAMRLSYFGITLINLMAAIQSIIWTILGFGMFATNDAFSLVYLQLFTGTIALQTLAIATVVHQRHTAWKSLAIAYEGLEKNHHELDSFVTMVAHDLKDPLASIRAYVKLLGSKYPNSDAQEYIDIISQSSQRAKMFINVLLDHARQHSRPLERQEFDVQEVINEVIVDLDELLRDNQALVKVVGELPRIEADKIRIKILFQNLIQNGINYKRDELPVIKISAKTNGSSHIFTVEDNGRGIPQGRIETLFVPYQKSDHGGLGLGLATCKRIVEKHGGKIWFTTEENQGSSFFFSI